MARIAKVYFKTSNFQSLMLGLPSHFNVRVLEVANGNRGTDDVVRRMREELQRQKTRLDNLLELTSSRS